MREGDEEGVRSLTAVPTLRPHSGAGPRSWAGPDCGEQGAALSESKAEIENKQPSLPLKWVIAAVGGPRSCEGWRAVLAAVR